MRKSRGYRFRIADAVKDGLGKMVDILDAAFKSATGGKSLAVAATEKDFVGQLSLFIKNAEQLPGAELAKVRRRLCDGGEMCT